MKALQNRYDEYGCFFSIAYGVVFSMICHVKIPTTKWTTFTIQMITPPTANNGTTHGYKCKIHV